MDFGFAGLIEKIEEHCGKFVATATLWLLILIVFSFGLELVVAKVDAVYLLIEGREKFTWRSVIDVAVFVVAIMGTAMFLTFVAIQVANRLWGKRLDKRLEEAREFEEGSRRRVEALLTEAERRLRRDDDG